MGIIDINEEKLKRGEPMFLHCGCDSNAEFGVQVISNKDRHIVCALVCLQCGKEFNVNGGEIL